MMLDERPYSHFWFSVKTKQGHRQTGAKRAVKSASGYSQQQLEGRSISVESVVSPRVAALHNLLEMEIHTEVLW